MSNFKSFASNRFRDDVSFKGSLGLFQTLTTAILMIWSEYLRMDEIAIHLQKIGNAMAQTGSLLLWIYVENVLIHSKLNRFLTPSQFGRQRFRSDNSRRTHLSFCVKLDDGNYMGICCRFKIHFDPFAGNFAMSLSIICLMDFKHLNMSESKSEQNPAKVSYFCYHKNFFWKWIDVTKMCSFMSSSSKSSK